MRSFLARILLFSLFLLAPFSLITAQDDNAIEFTGIVESIDGVMVVVSGLTVDVSDIDVATYSELTVGVSITIAGNLENGVIVATTVIVVNVVQPTPLPEATPDPSPEATAEATPEVTPEPTPIVDDSDDDDDDDGDSTDDDSATIIVIEGPVTNIEANIITIFSFEIILEPTDPNLTIIQIGDIIRVEGEVASSNVTIVIVAVTIIFVDIDVFISDDGEIWRDSENCSNPPPAWAPANGWRARCEGGSSPGIRVVVETTIMTMMTTVTMMIR